MDTASLGFAEVTVFVFASRPSILPDFRKLLLNAAVYAKWTAAVTAVSEGHTLSTASGPGAELLREFDRALATKPEPEYIQNTPLVSALATAFEGIYQGKGADGLYEYLTKMDERYQREDGLYYGKFISIVQSSGMGKTRTIFELAQKGVIVLYLNHRDKSDVNNWPPQTSVAHKWLNVFAGDANAYMERCSHFFTALFTEMDRTLTTLREADKTRDEVIADWSKIMLARDTSRYNDFFAKVDTRCQEYIAMDDPSSWSVERTASTTTSGIREAISGVASLSLTDKKDSADKKASPTGGTDSDQMTLPGAGVAQTRMTRAFASLCTSHTNFIQPSPHQPSIAIAFDEAHSLAKPTADPPFSRAHMLCRTISTFTDVKQSVWVIFASTNSRIADYSPPNILHRSSRVRTQGQLIFAPYTLVGSAPFAPSLETLLAHPESISKTRNLILFGRPLWRVVFDHLGDKFVGFVAEKLTNLPDGRSHPSTVLPDASALAILSPRFAVDVCFGHPESVAYADDAVASHLRVCLAITEDRMWSFTTYGSESLLAHVAGVLLTENPNAYQVLQRKLCSGMIERGKSGEMACRLLLLAGKDALLNSTPPAYLRQLKWNDDLFYCKPVSLLEYLEALLGPEIFPSDEAAKDVLVTDFADAKVNFSHWITMSQSISGPKREPGWSCKEWLFRHYARTCAVQCCHHQPFIDQVIPVYFDDATSSDPRERMSLIMVSDKATKSSNRKDLGFIRRESRPIDCVTEKPSIAILLDTGIVNANPKVSSTYNRGSSAKNRCWRIYAAGIGSETFPFLDKMNDGAKLKDVLNELANPTYLSPEEYDKAKLLRNRLQYGDTSEDAHMKWDA